MVTGWHYPRRNLAELYFRQLEEGLPGIAIFAERRKGKTEFLLQDLAPFAQRAGCKTVYVNFWEQKSHPDECIIHAVQRSVEAEHAGFSLLIGWRKEVSVKLAGIQAKLVEKDQPSPMLVSESLHLLTRSDGKVLIMFDEVQQLASSETFTDVIATIRTFLDSNKKKVKAVFTGSSQDGLNRIFKNQRAAFYNSASLLDFPDMGVAFIEHIVACFEDRSGRSLDADDAAAAFSRFYHSPFHIVTLLQTMLREGIYSIPEGVTYYKQTMNPENEEFEKWQALKPIDQLVLKCISRRQPLYQQRTYVHFAQELGLEEIGQGTVQASVNRLRDLGLVFNPARGQWEIESQSFAAFVEGV